MMTSKPSEHHQQMYIVPAHLYTLTMEDLSIMEYKKETLNSKLMNDIWWICKCW